MEDVATRAGVAKGTPYVYFSSKDALLRNVITQFLCAEIDRLERDLQDQLQIGIAADIIRRDLAGWWARVADSPASAVFKLIVSDIPARSELAAFCAAEGHRTPRAADRERLASRGQSKAPSSARHGHDCQSAEPAPDHALRTSSFDRDNERQEPAR